MGVSLPYNGLMIQPLLFEKAIMENTGIRWNIEDLIPHRGRMLLLEEILSLNTEAAISSARVREAWPLISEHSVSSLILIELAAQTGGLCNGLGLVRKHGEDSDKTGFLVGVKQAVFHVAFLPVGTRIITEAVNKFKFESFREIDGVSKVGSKVVCEVTLQVMQV